MDTLAFEEDRRVADALRFAGCQVSSVFDLVNTSAAYPQAIPILIKMLTDVRHPRVREGIARALSVKEASPVVQSLIDAFRSRSFATPQERHAKWAIGNAISVAADDDAVPAVAELLADKSHGLTRFMLPMALAKAKRHRQIAVQALMRALQDDEVVCKAAEALAKLRAAEALPALRTLANHENADIRKAATKAVKRLSK